MSELFTIGKQILEAQPFSTLLGAELVSLEKGKAKIALAIRQELKQQHGFIHGPRPRRSRAGLWPGLGATMEDVDLSFEDFVARVNADLVGKYVNIASRTAGFITRHFDGYVRAVTELEQEPPRPLKAMQQSSIT